MIRIGLVTRDGGEVANVLIPPFQCLPEVLISGGGARVLARGGGRAGDGRRHQNTSDREFFTDLSLISLFRPDKTKCH
jgi:hypothetical protein